MVVYLGSSTKITINKSVFFIIFSGKQITLHRTREVSSTRGITHAAKTINTWLWDETSAKFLKKNTLTNLITNFKKEAWFKA